MLPSCDLIAVDLPLSEKNLRFYVGCPCQLECEFWAWYWFYLYSYLWIAAGFAQILNSVNGWALS